METFGVGKQENQKYKKIDYRGQAVDELLVDAFLDSYRKATESIVLDVDPTDDHLLYAKLKTANLDPGNEALPDLQWLIGRIRARWPKVRITLREDSGFCREEMMRWCEQNGIFYVFGLARNARLVKRIAKQLKKARRRYYLSGQAQRIYKEFSYRTLQSWSRSRRVIGKAEYLAKGDNPLFVVTNLPQELIDAVQLRLYFSCLAYLLMSELRRRGLERTQFAKAQCHTIRLKLLKIGAQVRLSVRRVYVSLSSAYRYPNEFLRILGNLRQAYPQLA